MLQRTILYRITKREGFLCCLSICAFFLGFTLVHAGPAVAKNLMLTIGSSHSSIYGRNPSPFWHAKNKLAETRSKKTTKKSTARSQKRTKRSNSKHKARSVTKPSSSPKKQRNRIRTIANYWSRSSLPTFGSRKIINSCWSARELKRKPGEERADKSSEEAFMLKPKRNRPKLKFAPAPQGFRGSIRRVDTAGKKVIALTFDIGERNNDLAGYDGAIVDYLRKGNIKSTFYFGGKWMATHPVRTLQLMADPLVEMGNHAWTHGNLRVMRGRAMRDQILFTQVQFEIARDELASLDCMNGFGPEVIKRIPMLFETFRFPYGTCNRDSLTFVNNQGLLAIQWDVVTGDPAKGQSANAIARRVLKSAKPGSIVIMHANGRGWNTRKALPLFIPELQKRGYKFVTISELLRMGRPITTPTCYELKPGDNRHYDQLVGKGTGD